MLWSNHPDLLSTNKLRNYFENLYIRILRTVLTGSIACLTVFIISQKTYTSPDSLLRPKTKVLVTKSD